ncbi:type I Zorya anti-phage system protein ZorC [Pantoea sp. CCBC3-3-1]|uniref:type I Zorya anti-phage system protein ZorC n=1 Tax=Pantoea sp. CCBC3-3-1 TaxID=2490851 RepID=UPI0011BEDE71|nr:type I Zorya anti-phage system protein ZorC [Pantoea sp. CCBC3-3-1]
MMTALSRLTTEIAATVKRHTGEESTGFGEFPRLKAAEEHLAANMVISERTMVPPLEKRLMAIRALRQKKVKARDRYHWQLIFAGLADKDPDAAFPVLLEDDLLYGVVQQEIQRRIDNKKLKRREWKFLCSSYFGYHVKKPEENDNWCSLRDQLRISYMMIKSQVRREKRWMAVIDEFSDLFTSEAGSLLAEKMSAGELVDFSALENVAQVPDLSWLWYRAFVVLLAKVAGLDDDGFKERLPNLLSLAQQRERYRNTILRACLTRYYRSSFRSTPHAQLKQMALENWGSPQLRSKQNLWLNHLKDPETSEKICGMVRSWLAKEDLTHFFQLLKGSKEVDHARLFYWLRFANQMGFTRIVMGQDARNDKHSDFIAFREKNKGRLSNLYGGTSADNAVIMQIGDYLFVEFSRTGNAMYAYKISSAPFDPEKNDLQLSELKSGDVKYRHAPTALGYKDHHLTGWMLSYEDALRDLGITYLSPDSDVLPDTSKADISVNKVPINQREQDIQQLLKGLKATVSDKRGMGGALHIRLAISNSDDIAKLIRLGFKQKHGDPLTFWSR